MKNRVWTRFLRGQTVPGWRPLLGSVVVHCLGFAVVAWWLVLTRPTPVIVFSGGPQTVQKIPLEPVSLPPRSQPARLQTSKKNGRPQPRRLVFQALELPTESAAVEAIRQQAQQETKALVQNFKFRTTYGFSPFPRYELAFQISGQMPSISAAEVPPHFEQYVTVEVTINTDGGVADARIVSGLVDQKIQKTLLAAIREFKYRPATREGVPIPSQCDIVVHIPT